MSRVQPFVAYATKGCRTISPCALCPSVEPRQLNRLLPVLAYTTRKKPFAYTKVLRFLQIMMEKRLVVREDRDRTHSYAPSVPAERTQKQLVGDLMDRVFGGSARDLVLHALGARKVSSFELREIRKLLNELEP